MNLVIQSGRFTKDPEYSAANGDKMSVCKFTFAVNKKNGANFINCTAFGSTADFINKYFKKGMKALINGELETGSYKNKNNEDVYTWTVVVRNIEFGDSKKQDEDAAAPEQGE